LRARRVGTSSEPNERSRAEDDHQLAEDREVTPKASSEEEPEELLESEEDLEDVEDDEDEEEVSAGLALAGDDEEGDDASLEELLAQRASGRRAAGESDEEEDDIMSLASEREPTGAEVIRTTVIPIKDRKEFVCKNCHLVKARSQLADADRELCRDCV
jgi:hypothetical protein